jgi:hypothetical protein
VIGAGFFVAACATFDLNRLCPAGFHPVFVSFGMMCVADAVSIPTPTPTPVPTPVPTPEPDVCGGLPPAPVRITEAPCARGFEAIEGSGKRYCVASSACGWDSDEHKPGKPTDKGWALPGCYAKECKIDPALFGDDQKCTAFPTAAQYHLDRMGFQIWNGMYCESPEEAAGSRGCADAYGRRVRWNGSGWEEVVLGPATPGGARFSGLWHGFCPPQLTNACPKPEPTPTAPPTSSACKLPAMSECGAADTTGNPDGQRVWGCCREEEIRQVFVGKIEAAQAELERTRPDLFVAPKQIPVGSDKTYTTALAKLLTEKYGVCATSGGPEDEIGVKTGNGFSEQYDVVWGSQAGTWAHQTVSCRPARF